MTALDDKTLDAVCKLREAQMLVDTLNEQIHTLTKQLDKARDQRAAAEEHAIAVLALPSPFDDR